MSQTWDSARRPDGRKIKKVAGREPGLPGQAVLSQPGRLGEPSGSSLVPGVAHLVLAKAHGHHLSGDPALPFEPEDKELIDFGYKAS